MKTILILSLLFGTLAAQAQDFRAMPPSGQPNAAELAYFSGKKTNFHDTGLPDSTNVRLVLDFLNNLKNGQLEAAHGQLSANFKAHSPGFADFLERDNFLQQWERYERMFADQRVDIETSRLKTVADGARKGTWVYVKGVWSGKDNGRAGQRIQIPFHMLARLSGRLIEHTYTSYGNDQFFYDLGFPLYSTRAELTQKR